MFFGLGSERPVKIRLLKGNQIPRNGLVPAEYRSAISTDELGHHELIAFGVNDIGKWDRLSGSIGGATRCRHAG